MRRANNPRGAWDGRPKVPRARWIGSDHYGDSKHPSEQKHSRSPKLARKASTILVYLSWGYLRVVLLRESGEKFSRFIREDDSGVRRRKSARAVG